MMLATLGPAPWVHPLDEGRPAVPGHGGDGPLPGDLAALARIYPRLVIYQLRMISKLFNGRLVDDLMGDYHDNFTHSCLMDDY